ncbi:MAG: GxxExxY protein [Burkholderiales bacterium]
MNNVPISAAVDQTARTIVDAAFRVHTTLGPGLLESVYEQCLCHELRKRNVRFEAQVNLPIIYDDMRIDSGLRLDLLVEDQIIVELKATEKMVPLFEAQLLTYLKLTGKRLGLLINFNVPLIRDGIRRIVL